MAHVLPLGQAIGRWGNFFNYEAYGGPTNLPWKMYVPAHIECQVMNNLSIFILHFYMNLYGFRNLFISILLCKK